jgi:hypothetical protein
MPLFVLVSIFLKTGLVEKRSIPSPAENFLATLFLKPIPN